MFLFATLAGTLCLAYFYLVDRVVFSTSGFAPIFKFLLTQYDAQTAWLSLGTCFLALLWRKPAPILTLVDAIGRHPLGMAFGSAIVFSIGARYAYHNYPLSMDEYAAVFQSKIFAAGHLTAYLPSNAIDWLIVRGFNGSFLYASHESGMALEGYWPGFALLLAPFQALGIPWACNALLAASAVYLIFRIALDLTNDRRAAGWAVLFTLSSGAFVAYAISYYSMQAHLTANLLFAYLLLRPTQGRALAAGLAGSFALNLHNPFPHALFAAPWLVAMAANRQHRRYLGALLLGYLPGACVGIGWLLLRSQILATNPSAVVSTVSSGIFSWPDRALFDMRTASIVKLWLWASPCVLLLAWHTVRRLPARRETRLLAVSAAVTFIGYLFVRFDQGHGWGYRYFHSSWGCIPILAGVAMIQETSKYSRRLISFAGATAVLSLSVTVPFQVAQIDAFISQHLAQLPAPARPGGSVFFIKPQAGFYLADMIQIDPLLRSQDLLLVTRGPALDAELVRQNWPDARQTASGTWGQEWSIGNARVGQLRFDPHGGRNFR